MKTYRVAVIENNSTFLHNDNAVKFFLPNIFTDEQDAIEAINTHIKNDSTKRGWEKKEMNTTTQVFVKFEGYFDADIVMGLYYNNTKYGMSGCVEYGIIEYNA